MKPTILVVVGLIIGLAGSARAQVSPGELAAFDTFADRHPEIAAELRANPPLIDDWRYIQNHPALHEFLHNHPGVRAEFKAHPFYFEHREAGFERHEEGSGEIITRGELAVFDRFEDNHPIIGAELRHRPWLIDDPAYLNAHPELREFLAVHPGVRAQFQSHPGYFEHREQVYETNH